MDSSGFRPRPSIDAPSPGSHVVVIEDEPQCCDCDLSHDDRGGRPPAAPPTSLLQQWGALLTNPREWFLHPSCGGCLSQVSDHADATVNIDRVLSAQGSRNNVNSSSVKHVHTIKSLRDTLKSVSDIAPPPRRTNRSRASRKVHQGRINDLVTKIQSMPTPSSIRDQILTIHCHQQCVTDIARKASSPIPGNSKAEVLQVQPLSSTLSSPIYARSLFGLHSSPRGNWLEKSSSVNLRRAKSLKAQSSPTWIERKRPISTNSDDNFLNDQMKNSRLLEGIQFSDGEGLFSNAIDLNWCCPTSTDESVFSHICGSKKVDSRLKGKTDCGGYVDYAGKFHPCSSISHSGRHSRASTSGERCQGCIFRRGTSVNKKNDRSEDDDTLYYDSDPGERFSIDAAWMKTDSEQSSNSGSDHLEVTEHHNMQLHIVADTNFARHHSTKLSRRKDKSKGRRASNPADKVHVAHNTNEEEQIVSQQKDHQEHIYDYFSRMDLPSMQTGMCSTKILDVGRSVQDALSSTWRLYWHTNNIAKLCDVWIERGYRRNRTEIVEPKLMWREIPQPIVNGSRQLEIFSNTPCQVNLFSVRRILQLDNVSDGEVIDMDRHPQKHVLPFTKPNSLLLIRSSLDEDFIFEASCLAERDYIVHLMKIATARLVSHAVAGNGDMLLKEFFNDEHVP